MSRKSLLVMVAALIGTCSLWGFTFPEHEKDALINWMGGDSIPDSKTGFWAKETLKAMTLDEKIGQLFMVAAYSNKDAGHEAAIEKLVKEQQIGGLIFMQGGPGRQVKLVNRFQTAAKVPLLISQDSEWGLSMRLDSTIRYPKNMTLGAIRDSFALFELGMEIGRQCRQVGVQVNFAPVVDVNNNPNNPVINDRSYGENRHNVAVKGLFFYKGMEYANCVGTAKHFPGHGDTDTDSHHDLPVIEHPRERLDSLELYPFQYMFDRGVAGVMVAHLYIPALDSTPNLASTLSPNIVNDLLKNEMGFKGLTFTDALGMKGVTKFWKDGETDLKAFLAGNEVLLFSKDVPTAKKLIKQAILDGEVTEAELDRRVLKILVTKEWSGLHEAKLSPAPDTKALNSPDAIMLQKRLFQQSMTLVKNQGDMFPLTGFDRRRIALVEIGEGKSTAFYKTLRTYAQVSSYKLPAASTEAQRNALFEKLKPYNTILIGVRSMSKRASKNYGISQGTRSFVINLRGGDRQIGVVLFGSPYALKNFGEAENALMVAYEDQAASLEAAAEAVMGGIRVDGVLPVTASEQFPEGKSIVREKLSRFRFALPEGAGMDSEILNQIDGVANEAVTTGATPGCVVLVMRGDQIVFEKGYGRTEYGKAGKKVDAYGTIYDLASVTKIAATTITTMRLVEKGEIDLNEHVSAYLQDFRGKGLTHIRVRNLLMHNAGFRSWIPFYKETIDSTGSLDTDIYSNEYTDRFCIKVTDDLFICPEYKDSIWLKIVNSNVRTDSRVKYSDLSMMVMQKVIESVTKMPLDEYVENVFYKPLGMNNTGFKPHVRLKGHTFAPTENDSYWRNGKVQGHVHDQASAMLGGVSGHAGLFSNAYDLAKVLMMVKNGGRYNEENYFADSTVARFTAKQLDNSRKGMGWDKAEMDSTKSNPCSAYASELTYGHTGFTGIGAWVDPQYDLIYIFLSNRTFPTSENKKLLRQNIRPRIQDLIYESILSYERKGIASE